MRKNYPFAQIIKSTLNVGKIHVLHSPEYGNNKSLKYEKIIMEASKPLLYIFIV